MKYFPSPYIRALSKYDKRLEAYDGEKADVLVIEEKSRDLFLSENHSPMELIVLTESDESVLCFGMHKVKKRILKYKKIERLIAEIFDERHEIRLFISLFSGFAVDNLMQRNVINGTYRDIFDEFRYSDTLISEHDYLQSGVHYFYSSLLDVIDPPVPFITEAILKQSQADTVDIVLYSLNGILVKTLIEIANVVYLLVPKMQQNGLETLTKRYQNTVLLQYSNENDVDISNIKPRKGMIYEL